MSNSSVSSASTKLGEGAWHDVISLGQGPSLEETDLELIYNSFARHVESKPDSPAISYENGDLTYKEFNLLVNHIALNLISEGIEKGTKVALLLNQSPEMIASCLAVLKLGCAYIPLDPRQPKDRLNKILTDSSCSALIIEEEHKDSTPSHPCKTISISCIANESSGVFEPYSSNEDFDSSAYIIYTSGSTGEPKGVEISHRAIAQSTKARRAVYPGKPTFLLLSPVFCDSSLAGIWGTLTSGGHLVVASYDQCRDPEAILNLIITKKITHILCIPSLYDSLLECIDKSECAEDLSLTTVILAGEALHQSTVDNHFAIIGTGTELVNEYGPTEATVWATYHRLTQPENISIGTPIPGTSIYVLNDNLEPCPKGRMGEIFIGGNQLANGYLNKKVDTDKAFVSDPFSGIKASRMYKTGDLGYWNEDGTLSFSGRKDYQVKIRGFRVELGAVEASLIAIEDIREAVVVPNDNHSSLTAFIIAHKDINLDKVRETLDLENPPHMIPSKIIIKDELPRAASGKVDRAQLALHHDQESIPSSSKSDQLLHNPDEDLDMIQKVADAWAEILEQDSVPEDTNFFDLGGHSLMVFKLQQAIEKHTSFKPPVVGLFRHTTVSSQAEFIESQLESSLERAA